MFKIPKFADIYKQILQNFNSQNHAVGLLADRSTLSYGHRSLDNTCHENDIAAMKS